VTALRGQVVRQVGIGREGLGVEPGGGVIAAEELKDAQEREAFVVFPRLMFSPKERWQLRQNQGLSLATKHVANWWAGCGVPARA
jgi:hypothetical protein